MINLGTYDLQSWGENSITETNTINIITSNRCELVFNPIPESPKPTNCENCGAILHNGKCEYCGAEY